ncbi:hypothetical protein LTR62_007259 [Meristemomyces frigidus]|uniref:Uncharacterized protein n=1 Tax=Meristemomyces frigidus TaxID=1508187 RepID=A0AAN7TB97_9PEZI|nr:hypothetical protein LTR62_007259 [Meristemomyces frigidus]
MLSLSGLYAVLLSYPARSDAASVETHIAPRQNSADTITTYLNQINAARYAVSVFQAGTENTLCRDPDPADMYQGEPYDANMAAELICEESIGITIFPDLTQAARDLDVAYTGLQDVGNGISPGTSCQMLDLGTLDAGGINGTAVQGLICGFVAGSNSSSVVVAGSTVSGSSTDAAGLTTTIASSVNAGASTSGGNTGSSISTSAFPGSVSNTSTVPGTSTSSLAPITTSTPASTTPSSLSTSSANGTTTASSATSAVISSEIVGPPVSVSVPISISTSISTSTSATSELAPPTINTTLSFPPTISAAILATSISSSATITSPSFVNTTAHVNTATLLNTVWVFVAAGNSTVESTSTEIGSLTGAWVASGTGGCVWMG